MLPIYEDNGDGKIHINPEFIGQIIDIFDDFLESRDVRIPSSDAQMMEDGEFIDGENRARLYGSDYDELANYIEETVLSWTNDREKESEERE